ncbi:MAG TPA: family 1 glycosylhydrolase [Chryseosolibacter sp.]
MDKRFINSTPELWGGIECSYNRVQGKYFDQLEYSAHYSRIVDDIDAFSKLGITTMRYPVIWERHCPTASSQIDWQLSERGLNALRERNIAPVAGLVHHGSGPKYADFSSPAFATGLQAFAQRVAEKFPWIEYYTPVNEPLTTARFAGLYGLWYPHKRNDKAFVTILLNELKAVVLSMKAIREINPSAKLVQTEDLAKIYSTPFMAYQAEFENNRRWLTYDILCGKLRGGHPLWKYFLKYAPSEKDLMFFVENPCAPDILGMDYYATSERFLDERLDRYPPHTHGHNHRHKYADVEAVRVRINERTGIDTLLREVWQRYQLPMVLTEVHIHCDYNNQIRWFGKIRDACIQLMKDGIDFRAMTTWAMLGSYGWNRLLTSPGGDYESGAFDVSSAKPQRTPLADYLANLSVDAGYRHPVLDEKGWWEEDSRLLFENNPPAELETSGAPAMKEDCVEL